MTYVKKSPSLSGEGDLGGEVTGNSHTLPYWYGSYKPTGN